MFALACAPTRIYNSASNEEKPKHWRQHPNRVSRRVYAVNSPKVNEDTVKIKKLEKEVDRYKKANKKLRMIASWNLRAAQSAFKDSENILQILDDLYGDDAYENLSN